MKESAKLMVEDLQLADKHSTPASELSGGMKRKLRFVGSLYAQVLAHKRLP